jgi:hypothetical protein
MLNIRMESGAPMHSGPSQKLSDIGTDDTTKLVSNESLVSLILCYDLTQPVEPQPPPHIITATIYQNLKVAGK